MNKEMQELVNKIMANKYEKKLIEAAKGKIENEYEKYVSSGKFDEDLKKHFQWRIKGFWVDFEIYPKFWSALEKQVNEKLLKDLTRRKKS